MENTLETITRIFSEILGSPGLQLTLKDTPKTVSGWDSINHARILTDVEEAFSIRFRLRELASIQSVGDLVTLVDEKMKTKE